MMATNNHMNDHDFMEKNLLSSFDYQQRLNLPGPNDNYTNQPPFDYQQRLNLQAPTGNYTNYPSQYQLQYFDNQTNAKNSNDDNLASIVSMSTEEEDFAIFDLDLEAPVSKFPTNITMDTHCNTVSHVPVSPADKLEPKFKQQQQQQQQQQQKQRKQRKTSLLSRTNNKNSADDATTIRVSKRERNTRVGVPTKDDVLCGQSRVCASHLGNRTFQGVLEDFAHKYDSATSKQEKMQMTKAVVTIIHDSGGKFLKFKDGMWEEISTVAARDKVSHALRTKVSSWKRQQQQLMEDGIDSLSTKSLGRQSRSQRRSKSPKLHHRNSNRRCSSKSTTATDIAVSSDIVPIPIDAGDIIPTVVMSGLLHSQQQIFANLTTPALERTASLPAASNGHRNLLTLHSNNGATNYNTNTNRNSNIHHSRNNSF